MKFINRSILLNNLQRKLAGSVWVTILFVKIRNQANKIIGYHLSQSPDHLRNGENAVLSFIAPQIKLAIDAGANTGEWSELLLSKYVEDPPSIHVFEPGTIAFSAASKRFANNDCIVLNKSGLSDTEGKLFFFENIDRNRTSSFLDLTATDQINRKEVELTTIDVYCKKNQIHHVDLLKIDCEGFDLKVLMGCKQMLKNASIQYIQFEYGSGWREAGATLKAAYNLLHANQYNFFVLSPVGLLLYRPDTYGEFFEYANFFAVHHDSLDKISGLINRN